MTCFNLSREFDLVNSEILPAKRSKLDVQNSLLSWHKRHSRDKKCFVSSNCNYSASYQATPGVPRASVFDILLF